jgi:hypothetical protein
MRNALRNGRIEWQRHALERMTERAIRRSDALEVLLAGELIEDYSDDYPFPDSFWVGYTRVHFMSWPLLMGKGSRCL